MAVSSEGLRPKSDRSGKAEKQLYSKLQTRPLVREGAPYQYARNCQTENKQSWSRAPDGSSTDSRS
jgi:hypothetical protein